MPVIYDKSNQNVQLLEVIAQPKGTEPPTKLHWVNFGHPYFSDPFTGSGTRYSGYIFGLDNSDKCKLDFELGGFMIFVTDRPDPGAILYSVNLPLENAPYHVETGGYFYFAVDNPKKGQTYTIIVE
ncbi:hypothetical protein RV11_GL003144 [Enterococcus phoeniculicola]|nr:hypothetical protein RV11_GL003144 [Enterococcus phoeniculicola]